MLFLRKEISFEDDEEEAKPGLDRVLLFASKLMLLLLFAIDLLLLLVSNYDSFVLLLLLLS